MAMIHESAPAANATRDYLQIPRFAPPAAPRKRAPAKERTFEAPQSRATIRAILAWLPDHPGATIAQVAAAIGKCESTAGMFLRHMSGELMVEQTPGIRAQSFNGPSTWKMRPGKDEWGVVARDWLVAAFFGPASTGGGA